MKFLIASIVGAIIGYITNWLAIKMLFRPYNEVRIFGKRVPFTPGLIPKEKSRVAKSVGETIGKHLLSKETMVEALSSEKMNNHISNWLHKELDDIQKNNVTIEQKTRQALGNQYDETVLYINKKAIDITLVELKKDATKTKIMKYIIKIINKELDKSPEYILESELYNSLVNKFTDEIGKYNESGDLKNNIREIIKNEIEKLKNRNDKLKEIIPQSFTSTLKVYIYNNSDKICKDIKSTINENNIRNKIKIAITEMVSSNLNPMVAMFLNSETIFTKIMNAINSYLEKEENQKQVAMALNDVVDKMLESNISEVISSISEGAGEENISVISGFIARKLSDDEFTKYIINNFENNFKSYNTLQKFTFQLDNNYEVKLSDFIRQRLDTLIESLEFNEFVESIINSIQLKFMSIPIRSLLTNKNEADFIIKMVEEYFKKFVDNKAIEIIEVMNIADIVEDKINGFDVSFAEELIVEIASKELNAITWLGALLGGVLGIASPLLNLLG